jgi:hypothetical protein
MQFNNNENINTSIEEMRIFRKNNARGVNLSNVPYASDGTLNDPKQYARLSGYAIDGTFGKNVDLSNVNDATKQYYNLNGTNKYCNEESDCIGTNQSESSFKTITGSDIMMEKVDGNNDTTLLLCSADGTTCEDNYMTKDSVIVIPNNSDECNNLSGVEQENCFNMKLNFGGQQSCKDSCSDDSSCSGYNYFGANDICMTVSDSKLLGMADISSMAGDFNIVGGVKLNQGDFVEKFSNEDILNLSKNNTSYLTTIQNNQTATLNNLKSLTDENEIRSEKFSDLIKSKNDIANTKARMIQIENEHLIYKNKILYSVISLIFVIIIVMIMLYKMLK